MARERCTHAEGDTLTLFEWDMYVEPKCVTLFDVAERRPLGDVCVVDVCVWNEPTIKRCEEVLGESGP